MVFGMEVGEHVSCTSKSAQHSITILNGVSQRLTLTIADNFGRLVKTMSGLHNQIQIPWKVLALARSSLTSFECALQLPVLVTILKI